MCIRDRDYDYVDPHFGVIVKDGGEPLPEWENDNARASKYIQRVTDTENLEASNKLLIKLIEEIHRRGMKIILDGVFNHCGSFNKWLDRERIYEGAQGYAPGAYVSADSPYRNFFKFNNEHEWPYNPYYDGWWGHDTLPKLNYEQSQMCIRDRSYRARNCLPHRRDEPYGGVCTEQGPPEYTALCCA